MLAELEADELETVHLETVQLQSSGSSCRPKLFLSAVKLDVLTEFSGDWLETQTDPQQEDSSTQPSVMGETLRNVHTGPS